MTTLDSAAVVYDKAKWKEILKKDSNQKTIINTKKDPLALLWLMKEAKNHFAPEEEVFYQNFEDWVADEGFVLYSSTNKANVSAGGLKRKRTDAIENMVVHAKRSGMDSATVAKWRKQIEDSLIKVRNLDNFLKVEHTKENLTNALTSVFGSLPE